MGIKVKMEDVSLTEKMKESTDSSQYLAEEDKTELIKTKYRLARNLLPDYEALKREIEEYSIELPPTFTIQELAAVNKIYSIAQEYCSRVSTIENIAIDNLGRWERLHNLIKGYIEEQECKLLVTEEVMELPNSKIQQAFVRNKLAKYYTSMEKIADFLSEADSFKKIIETKKKDILILMTNLTRQVKVITTEQSIYRA